MLFLQWTSLKHLQAGWLQRGDNLPEPITMPDHPRVTIPKLNFPFLTLRSFFLVPSLQAQQKRPVTNLATNSFQALIESSEIPLEPLLLETRKPNTLSHSSNDIFPRPFMSCPSLDTLSTSISFSKWEMTAALQVWPQHCWVQGVDPFLILLAALFLISCVQHTLFIHISLGNYLNCSSGAHYIITLQSC